MKNYVIFALLFCILALSNAKSHSKEDKHSKEESSEEPNSQGLNRQQIKVYAQQLNEKFDSKVLLDAVHTFEDLEKQCPGLELKLKTAIEEVGECVKEIETGSQTLCSILKNNWAKCTKPIREVAISCLSKGSKVIPVMLDEVIVGTINAMCSSTVEEILELLNPCVFEGYKNVKHDTVCIKLKYSIERERFPSWDKSVCGLLPKYRNCGKSLVESTCKNPVTVNANVKFFNVLVDATKDECDNLNKP